MNHPIRYRLEWLALVALRLIARVMPWHVRQICGAGLGQVIGLIWLKRRAIAEDNLSKAFPVCSSKEIHQTAGRVFANFGRTAFEIASITPDTPEKLLELVDCPSLDVIDDAQSNGKGAVLMSGHIGNWELFAGYLSARGYPIDVIVKPMRNPLADRFYNARRGDLGVGIIHTQTATRGIVEALKNRRMIAILADQHAGEDGIEVEFFGRSASTPRGPAALALRYGCPILSGVMIRKQHGRFQIEIDPPLKFTASGDGDLDARTLTQLCASRLESHIRKYPDQWLWTHRRWRERN